MPVVKRAATIDAPREQVWELVSDPERLPGWWPDCRRVEEATPDAWTTVLETSRGRPVRADYTRLEADPPSRLRWRHEVEESPFERVFTESLLDIELAPAEEGGTRVVLVARQRTRGFSRFGGLFVRRATGRLLDRALAGLGELVAARG